MDHSLQTAFYSEIKMLIEQLTRDFGKGFDRRNLFYMRKFYSAFPIVNVLRSQLSWTHYRMIINVEYDNARLFYINESAENHWSTRQLGNDKFKHFVIIECSRLKQMRWS